MNLIKKFIDILLLLCIISIGLNMPDIFENFIRFYSEADHIYSQDNYMLCLNMTGGILIGSLSVLFVYNYNIKYIFLKYFIAFGIYLYFKFYFLSPIVSVYYAGGNEYNIFFIFLLSTSILISYKISTLSNVNFFKRILMVLFIIIPFIAYFINTYNKNQNIPFSTFKVWAPLTIPLSAKYPTTKHLKAPTR